MACLGREDQEESEEARYDYRKTKTSYDEGYRTLNPQPQALSSKCILSPDKDDEDEAEEDDDEDDDEGDGDGGDDDDDDPLNPKP